MAQSSSSPLITLLAKEVAKFLSHRKTYPHGPWTAPGFLSWVLIFCTPNWNCPHGSTSSLRSLHDFVHFYFYFSFLFFCQVKAYKVYFSYRYDFFLWCLIFVFHLMWTGCLKCALTHNSRLEDLQLWTKGMETIQKSRGGGINDNGWGRAGAKQLFRLFSFFFPSSFFDFKYFFLLYVYLFLQIQRAFFGRSYKAEKTETMSLPQGITSDSQSLVRWWTLVGGVWRWLLGFLTIVGIYLCLNDSSVDICMNIGKRNGWWWGGVERVQSREKVKASDFIDCPKTPADSQGHCIELMIWSQNLTNCLLSEGLLVIGNWILNTACILFMEYIKCGKFLWTFVAAARMGSHLAVNYHKFHSAEQFDIYNFKSRARLSATL